MSNQTDFTFEDDFIDLGKSWMGIGSVNTKVGLEMKNYLMNRSVAKVNGIYFTAHRFATMNTHYVITTRHFICVKSHLMGVHGINCPECFRTESTAKRKSIASTWE